MAAALEQPDRLSPTERTGQHVVLERRGDARRREGKPDRDRSQQDAWFRKTDLQPAIVEDSEPTERDHETGRPDGPRQPPAPGDERGDKHREIQGDRQDPELTIAQTEAGKTSDSERSAADRTGRRSVGHRRRHAGDQVPAVTTEQR